MKLLKFLVSTVLSIAATVALGYAFATTWSWFVCPVFDVPAITTKQGVGLMLQFGWLITTLVLSIEFARAKYDEHDDQNKALFRPIATLIAVPFGLLFDYLYYLYL